jgi:hypothetical protein
MWNVLDEFGAHGLPLGALVLVKIIAGVGYPLQARVGVIFEREKHIHIYIYIYIYI